MKQKIVGFEIGYLTGEAWGHNTPHPWINVFRLCDEHIRNGIPTGYFADAKIYHRYSAATVRRVQRAQLKLAGLQD